MVSQCLARIEKGEVLTIREAEAFVAAASDLLGKRFHARSAAALGHRSEPATKAYEEAQRFHDLAHKALEAARAKRCGRCKNWMHRPNYFGCSAFRTGYVSEQKWMFVKDGPPWENCRRFEPTPEALGG